MHRSGTSMVARLVSLAGLYIGRDEELVATTPINLKGHWEPRWMLDFNDRLLAQLQGTWDAPPHLPGGWENRPDLVPLRSDAQDSIARMYAGQGPWCWKEPRTTILIPFWRTVVGKIRFVVCIRNPLDVAESARTFEDMPVDQGLALWQIYTEAALRDTRPEERIIVRYEDFFTDHRSAMAPVLEFLSLPRIAAGSDTDKAIQSFVSRGLRHHQHTPSDVFDNPGVPDYTKRLYSTLLEARGSGGELGGILSDSSQLDQIYACIDESAKGRAIKFLYSRLYAYVQEENGRRLAAEEEVRRLHAVFHSPPYSYLTKASAIARNMPALYWPIRRHIEKLRNRERDRNSPREGTA